MYASAMYTETTCRFVVPVLRRCCFGCGGVALGEVNDVTSKTNASNPYNTDTTFGLQFGVYIERMKETHTMTTTHDIPDDIREALKIREDLWRFNLAWFSFMINCKAV